MAILGAADAVQPVSVLFVCLGNICKVDLNPIVNLWADFKRPLNNGGGYLSLINTT